VKKSAQEMIYKHSPFFQQQQQDDSIADDSDEYNEPTSERKRKRGKEISARKENEKAIGANDLVSCSTNW
jgi:hypothetical protein